MRPLAWLAAGAVALAACERGSTIAVRLIKPVQATPGYPPSYLVEVEHEGRRDTITGVRVWFAPTVRGSTVTGIGVTNVFTYDASTGRLDRSGLPRWFEEEVTQFVVPALSPDGRHVAYLASPQNGPLETRVRSWPDGELVVRGPPAGEVTGDFRLGRTIWADNRRFSLEYDLRHPGTNVRVLVHGRLGATAFDVDTLSRSEMIDSLAAAARATADSVARVGAESAATRELARAARQRLLDSALKEVRRLPVTRFPQLPAAFAQELASRDCLVPQGYYRQTPHNVIRGSFGARGQDDWAALCSRGDESVILVHWGGHAQCPRELRPARDMGYLLMFDSVHVEYIRVITTTDHHGVLDERDQIVKAAPLEHDGIAEVIAETSSQIWFCRAGTWTLLSGMH